MSQQQKFIECTIFKNYYFIYFKFSFMSFYSQQARERTKLYPFKNSSIMLSL